MRQRQYGNGTRSLEEPGNTVSVVSQCISEANTLSELYEDILMTYHGHVYGLYS